MSWQLRFSSSPLTHQAVTWSRLLEPRSSRDASSRDQAEIKRATGQLSETSAGLARRACCPSGMIREASPRKITSPRGRKIETVKSSSFAIRASELCPTRPHPCPRRWSSGRSLRLPLRWVSPRHRCDRRALRRPPKRQSHRPSRPLLRQRWPSATPRCLRTVDGRGRQSWWWTTSWVRKNADSFVLRRRLYAMVIFSSVPNRPATFAQYNARRVRTPACAGRRMTSWRCRSRLRAASQSA